MFDIAMLLLVLELRRGEAVRQKKALEVEWAPEVSEKRNRQQERELIEWVKKEQQAEQEASAKK